MIEYKHLLGRPFVWGTNDCYGLLREFYRDNFKIELPNFARPEDFWMHGLNLFVDNYFENGFRHIDVHPTQWQIGDVFLMAIDSKTPNHCAVLVENGYILHHLYNQLSKVELYRRWRDYTIGVYRHKDVKIEVTQTTEDLMQYLPNNVRKKLDALRNDPNGTAG